MTSQTSKMTNSSPKDKTTTGTGRFSSRVDANEQLGISGRTYLANELEKERLQPTSTEFQCVMKSNGQKRLIASEQFARSLPRQFIGPIQPLQPSQGQKKPQNLRTTF
jgi:hypothetical protein